MKILTKQILTGITITAIFSCCEPSVEKVFAIKEVVVEGLRHPWSIAFLSEEEVLVTEKDGDLIRINLRTKKRSKIYGFPEDLADSIRIKDPRDNSGIFEILLHPNFKSNQLIYVSYAAQNDMGTTTKIIRSKLVEDSLTLVTQIFVASPYSSDLFHYGGGMTFGSDGKLYFTIGERLYNEREEPSLPIAQDITDKRGKIYRLNPDGSVPEDNPDFGSDAVPGIYAIGIRAAQGITLNERSNQIWFSEHGSTQGDEINTLSPGANYGWPIKTSGKYRNLDYVPPQIVGATFEEPTHYWLQTIAPTGLIFHIGTEFPQWKDDLILSGLSRGSLWRLVIKNDTVLSVEELFVHDRIRSRKVAQSPKGKLYLLTDESNGKILRIRNGVRDDL